MHPKQDEIVIFIEPKEDSTEPDKAKIEPRFFENISENTVEKTNVPITGLNSVEMNVSSTEEIIDERGQVTETKPVEMNISTVEEITVDNNDQGIDIKTLEIEAPSTFYTTASDIKQSSITKQIVEEDTNKDGHSTEKEELKKDIIINDLGKVSVSIEDTESDSEATSEFDVGTDIEDTNVALEEEEIISNDIIKSKHEQEIFVEPINVEIAMDAVLKCVGTVLDRVENVIVVQQHDTGEERVLDLNSILLYEDRTIIGRISDTFGPVTQPLYTIHFSSIEEATERFRKYAQVLYVPDLAHILMTRPLKTKGTDASNLWDEEVGENEMEFSDDEKEREFKRRRKQADSSRKKMKQSSISPLNPTPRPTPFKRNVQSNPVPPASLYNTFTNGQNLNSLLGMVYPNMNLFPPMQLDFNQLQQLQQMQQAQMQNYSQQQSIQQLSGLLHQLQRQQDNQKPESE